GCQRPVFVAGWSVAEILPAAFNIRREPTGGQHDSACGANEATAIGGPNDGAHDDTVVDHQVLGFGVDLNVDAHVFGGLDESSDHGGAIHQLHAALVGGHIPDVRDDALCRVHPAFGRKLGCQQDILQILAGHNAHPQKGRWVVLVVELLPCRLGQYACVDGFGANRTIPGACSGQVAVDVVDLRTGDKLKTG